MNKKFKILSLDGGGFMGVIAARFLQKLNLRGSDFDLIAGTSTGSILAAGLRLGLTPSDFLELYRVEGKNIFPPYWKRLFTLRAFGGLFRSRYSSEPLKKILDRYFQNTGFSEVDKLIVTTYNIQTKEFICARSWTGNYSGRLLKDLVLSSCSAPVYFEPNGSEVDGGIVVNNPSMVAVASAIKLGVDVKDIELVSIGTGYLKEPMGALASKLGAVSWGVNFPSLTLQGTSQVVDYQCKQIFKESYFRFDPLLRFANDKMDEAGKEQFENLLKDADYQIDTDREYIDKFFDKLLAT